jgi:hypothetical protein
MDSILIGFVGALLVIGCIEGIRQGWAYLQGRAAAPADPGPAPVDSHTAHTAGKTILRLIIALLVGFFLGAITAGIIEAIRDEEIAFGSLLANTLIGIWTALIWLFLSRRDADTR